MLHEIGGRTPSDAHAGRAPDAFASGLTIPDSPELCAARDPFPADLRPTVALRSDVSGNPLPGGHCGDDALIDIAAGRRIGSGLRDRGAPRWSAAPDPIRPAVDAVTPEVVMPGGTHLPSARRELFAHEQVRPADPIAAGLSDDDPRSLFASGDPHSGVFA